MKKRLSALLGLVTIAAVAAYGDDPAPAGAAKDAVARGRYLANDVAMCVQCHSPRDARGAVDASRLFTGAPVPVSSPPFPGLKWAAMAPSIAGLTGYTDEQAMRLLTEGLALDGRRPSAPMPPFRLSREDAEAVVAYLRSLR